MLMIVVYVLFTYEYILYNPCSCIHVYFEYILQFLTWVAENDEWALKYLIMSKITPGFSANVNKATKKVQSSSNKLLKVVFAMTVGGQYRTVYVCWPGGNTRNSNCWEPDEKLLRIVIRPWRRNWIESNTNKREQIRVMHSGRFRKLAFFLKDGHSLPLPLFDQWFFNKLHLL